MRLSSALGLHGLYGPGYDPRGCAHTEIYNQQDHENPNEPDSQGSHNPGPAILGNGYAKFPRLRCLDHDLVPGPFAMILNFQALPTILVHQILLVLQGVPVKLDDLFLRKVIAHLQ